MGRFAVTKWEDMRDKLESKYLPSNYLDTLQQKFFFLFRQGTLSLDEYTEKFNEYAVRCKVMEEERTIANHYRTDLRQEIRREVVLHDFETVDEIYNKPRWVELELQPQNMWWFDT